MRRVNLCTFRGVQNPEAISTIRPHKQQRILALGNFSESLSHVARALHFVPVHLENDISLLQPGIVSRTSRLHLRDHRTVNVTWRLQLVAQVRGKILQTEAPVHLSLAFAGSFIAFTGSAAEFLQSDGNVHRFAIAKYGELDFRSRLLLSDHHLELSRVADLAAVDFGDDISDLQPSFRCGRIGLDLRDNTAHGSRVAEELRVFRSYIRDSDAHVSMADLTIANERLDCWPDDLCRNRESHS